MTAKHLARPALAFGKVGVRTPLLEFLAGEHATDAARVWDAPHNGFFVMPAARRHAAGMILSGLAADTPASAGALRTLVERERDPVVARAVTGRDAHGFMKALAKMGEVLWTRDDYARFLILFAEPNANAALRHMDELRPDRFTPLVVLPAALRTPRIIRAVPNGAAATDLALAHELAIAMNGREAGAKLVDRWNRAATPQALFAKAIEDLEPEDLTPPVREAPVLPAPFEAVTTRKALEAVALEFRNCLRDYAADIARGRMAVYAWRGEPKAAVALTLDVAGWRLAEASGYDNADLAEIVLSEIVAGVEAEGVRTGPAVATLVGRLAGYRDGRTVYDERQGGLYNALELGDLWN